MRVLSTLFVVAALCMLSSCAFRAAPETDALAKLMRPVEGKAVIYVFRNEEPSAPWPIALSLDGKGMGSTGADTYVRWSVEPGQHILVSHAENDSPLVLQTEPGKIYYVWQEVSMGILRPRTTLHEVDRNTAEVALRSCYLLRS